MANPPAADEKKPAEAAPEDGEATEAPKKRGLSKLLLLVGAPLILLLGAGAGAFFLGAFDSLLGRGGHGAAAHAAKPALFFDLPDMLVNLNAANKHATYLKLKVALEYDDPDLLPKLTNGLPRVVDSFQIFLRELRIEDLSGSAGMMRLKEELLLRINATVEGGGVRDVLFKEMLVQ